jgi:hypothetical protein
MTALDHLLLVRTHLTVWAQTAQSTDPELAAELHETSDQVYQAICKLRDAEPVLVAKKVVFDFLRSRGCDTTGIPSYTGAQWKARGEDYGQDSLLVILHEEGDHRPFFSMDACYRTGAASDYEPFEALMAELQKHGLWFETCTSWYSAVYHQAQA